MAQLFGKAKTFIAEKVINIKKPEASIEDVDLKDVNRECITYKAQVAVKNPYGHALPICDISYTLKSSGREIASGKIPDPGSLKAEDTTMLNVDLKVPHNVLATLVKDVGADWDIDYELEVALVIDLPIFGRFTIPLNKKGEIKLPSLTDLF